jgi:hypothetical protein
MKDFKKSKKVIILVPFPRFMYVCTFDINNYLLQTTSIKFFFAFALFFAQFGLNVQGQTDTSKAKDVSYYFDDNGISELKNVLKINILSIIQGDVPFYYERTFNKILSIEAGLGFQLPYFVKSPISIRNNEDPIIKSPDSGLSIWIFPRFYLAKTAPEGIYIGPQFRKRFYNQGTEKINVNDITYNAGLQFFTGKHFIIDLATGAGVSIINRTQPEALVNRYFDISYQIDLKIGYRF